MVVSLVLWSNTSIHCTGMATTHDRPHHAPVVPSSCPPPCRSLRSRGSILTTCIFVYAVMSPAAGYIGGALYARSGGKEWIRHMLLTAFLVPGVVCTVAFLINFVAIYYHATRAFPIETIVSVVAICFFVILPLTMVGVVLGRNLSGSPEATLRVNPVPRPIPEKKWYMETGVIAMLGGVLPFGSIFIGASVSCVHGRSRPP